MSETKKEGWSGREGGGERERARLLGWIRSPAVQLLGYFVAVGGLLVVAGVAFPPVRELYLPLVSAVEGGNPFEEIAAPPEQSRPLPEAAIEAAVISLLVLTAALLFAIPVVRIYVVTMRQEGYEKSFVRLLVALPVVVAAVVRIVQDDLALAFALAGIVAAVRFRTTVKDLQDAFFAFAAIGIGLAAGTGNLVTAAVASFVLTTLVYAMWRLDVGDIGPSLELPYGGVSLSEALVPGEAQDAVFIGDREELKSVEPADLQDLQDAISNLAGYVRADSLRKKKKYTTLAIGHVLKSDADEGRKAFENVLEEHVSRQVLVSEHELEDSEVMAYGYLVRLKKQVDIGQMVDDFECSPQGPLIAVELKPIGGLRDRLT